MSKTTEQQLEEKEEFLHLLHQVVQHTPLKLEETSGTEYDKGYIFYQDMVLRDVEELETTMWEWHQKKCQERDRIAREEEREKWVKLIRDEYTIKNNDWIKDWLRPQEEIDEQQIKNSDARQQRQKEIDSYITPNQPII